MTDRRNEAARRLGAKACNCCGEPCEGTDARGVDATIRLVQVDRLREMMPLPDVPEARRDIALVRLCERCYEKYKLGADRRGR